MNGNSESPSLGHPQQQRQRRSRPQQQQQQSQPQAPSLVPPALESVTKTLTRLVSIPSNRSCADCKSPLVDALQVYASYSNPENHEISSTNHTNFRQSSPLRHSAFHQNHFHLAPPGAATPTNWKKRKIPIVYDPPVDPAVTVSEYCGHGVFVCALCGAAHKLLRTVTTVAAVHDPQHWTLRRVQILARAGGNAHATAVLEAYYTPQAQHMVPRPSSQGGVGATLADRLTFCRAKYEALAFCLPPALGPCARDAWYSIMQRHAEWKTLWNHPNSIEGTEDWIGMPSLSGLELKQRGGQPQQQSLNYYLDYPSAQRIVDQQLQPARTVELPDRLVDYFCVVTASDYLHPSASSKDLTHVESPQDIWLAPRVSDCFPDPNNSNCFESNNNNDDASSLDSAADDSQCPAFPEHVSTFVFPDGCCASTTALPPAFFTLVLTNAAGERLYGGVLRLYDDGVDTIETLQRIMDHSEHPDHLRPPWLRQKRQQQQQQQQQKPPQTTTPRQQKRPPSSHVSISSSNNNNNNDFNPFDSTLTRKMPPRSMSSSSLRTTDSHHSLASAGYNNNNNKGGDVMFLPKCLVILSHYPFFDLWRNFLLQIYRIALTEAPLPMERFVANFVREVPLPPPGKVQVKFGFTVKDIWTIERPPENQLPMANFSYRPLFASLSISNVLVVMGCLLQETRVALVSQHYALLGPVAEALLSFLFPLHWQGLYLTLVPRNMLDILDAPVPYLVGLHARYLRETPAEDRPHGVVFVDLDRDEVHLGFADDDASAKRIIPSLPERDVGKLKDMLMKHAACAYVMPSTQVVGSITTGKGEQIPYSEREFYAQISALERPSPESLVRRQDVFPNTEKAFRDNELLNPISGFLSEHGQLYQRDTSNPEMATKGKKPMLKLVPPSLRRNGSRVSGHSHHHSSSSHGDLDSNSVENLLDLTEPTGFSSLEIRQAFLRFFVSLLRDYRKYLDEENFRGEEFVDGLGLSAGSSAFVKGLLQTQMFYVFTDERRENPTDPEVLFFDDSITAKLNRSKKTALTRGGKKETKFLNDTRSMVAETFTPPPPSNWGLESGKTYQYGTFPTLDSALYGQIRPPMKFENRQLQSAIRMSRRMSAFVQASEREVVEKATRSVLTKVTKRGFKNLESALKALSTPFVPPRRTAASTPSRKSRRESAGDSVVSDVTMPSTFELTEEVVSAAEMMIWNARRKQAILIGIIVTLQRLCRQYLERRRTNGSLLQGSVIVNALDRARSFRLLRHQAAASTRIQRFYRFWRIRHAAVRIQAWRRGNTVFWAFKMLLTAISRAQAVYRGVAVRQACRKMFVVRLDIYRSQLFRLWQKADTPLSYRSKFWPLLHKLGFVRLAIAEHELKRLWKDMGLQASLTLDKVGSTEIESLQLGDYLGIRNDAFSKCIRITGIRPSVLPKTKSMRASRTSGSILHGSSSERVLAERLQVYERLSLPAYADRTGEIFSNFSISTKDKQRKAALANVLWCNIQEADRSSELFLQLFPELRDSTNIFFMTPSKRALRRFPSSSGATPSVLDQSMWAHRILDDRIRHHTAEIADITLHCLPERMKRLEMGCCFQKSIAQSQMVRSIMSSLGIQCESMARRIIMQENLFDTRHTATTT